MMRPRAALRVLAGLGVADLLLLLWPGIGDTVRLGGHVATVVAGYGVTSRVRPLGMRVAIAGMAGPLGLLAAHALAWRRRLRLASAAEPPAPQWSEAPATAARMLDGRFTPPTPDMLGSLATVLRHGDIAARRHALEAVVRSFEPGLSTLILQALSDPDQGIRALAAAASARVARNLAQRRAALEARMAKGEPQAERALAVLLADHARDNVLLSDAQRAAMRREALALVQARPPAAERNALLRRLLMETAWDAGDYDLIDQLHGGRADAPHAWSGWWGSRTPA